jgi:phenylpyruvate tautomerase PptA (4-oxalocrotonate tautomerase family)
MPICTVTVAKLSLSLQQKSQIAEATTASHSAQIVDIAADDVRVYLPHIPATQIIEFGRFLPAPGDEAEREKAMTLESGPVYPNNRNNRSVAASPVLSAELLLTSCTANYFLALYGFNNA